MARPTKYTKEIVDKAKAYIDNYETEYKDAIPSVVGLCSALNIDRSTVYDWANDENKEFSYILEAINRKQQQVLINKGLTNQFNANITKLVLGKHGFSDKQDLNAEGSLTINVNR